MIKRIIFSLICVCVSMNAFSYTLQASRKAVPSGKHTVVRPWKYGVSLSSGILSRRIGGFVEYKTGMIGMEAGLAWFGDRYEAAGLPLKGSKVGVGIINYSTFVVPLVLKLYPGIDRQFAIRAGLQVGYAIQNKIYLIRNFKGGQLQVNILEAIDDKNYVDVSSVAASEDTINDWYGGSIVGFEYETDFGFIWGFDYMNKLTSFIEAEEEKYAFSFMLNLGMNLGIFFY